MLRIRCPYCQEVRSEEEFSCAGEAHIRRPEHPEDLSDQEWGEYLHFRTNARGPHREMWVHAAGCRRYFNVLRDTVSYEILEVYPIGALSRGARGGTPRKKRAPPSDNTSGNPA